MPAKQVFTVAHDGISMNVLAMGQGDPVVFVHGFGGASDSWFFNTRPLAQRFRVYAVDLPGFGRSAKRVRGEILPFFAEWVERLLDLNGHASAHVVGHSMGGAVSLHLAATRPERVQRLVLVDPAGLAPIPSGDFIGRMVDARTREQVRAALSGLFHDQAFLVPETVEKLVQYKEQPGARAVLAEVGRQLAGIGRDGRLRSGLSRFAGRTLVVWGREDRVVPAAHADTVRGLPNVQVHVFDRCGHIPQVEHSEAFNSLLFEFLTSP